MDITMTRLQVRAMNIDERIRLVEGIWDDIAADGGPAGLTQAQEQELDRRLADDEAHPDDVIPWETIKAEAHARCRK